MFSWMKKQSDQNKSRRLTTEILLLGVLILMGIALGVAALIVVIAVMTGFPAMSSRTTTRIAPMRKITEKKMPVLR